MKGLIRVTPDKERARSILKMANTTIEMINTIDIDRFSSNIIKECYEVIRELISIILLLDGYRTHGEGAHIKLLKYIQSNYKEFNGYEISLIDELRSTRNMISYDGFFADKDYIERKSKDIDIIVDKLKGLIKHKLK